MAKLSKRAKGKKSGPRFHAINLSPVTLTHPTLSSQLLKNTHEQARQSEIAKDEPYAIPKD